MAWKYQIAMNKRVFFIIVASTSFGIIIISIIIIISFNMRQQTPSSIDQPVPTPYPTFQGKTLKSRVPHDQADQRKSVDSIKNRQELSTQGRVARQNLINSMGNASGVLQETNTYRLEYIKLPDIFMAEILTTNITQAKQDVESYLLQQGFSQSDICYLPLVFYLNASISQSLRGTAVEFSPLPLGC